MEQRSWDGTSRPQGGPEVAVKMVLGPLYSSWLLCSTPPQAHTRTQYRTHPKFPAFYTVTKRVMSLHVPYTFCYSWVTESLNGRLLAARRSGSILGLLREWRRVTAEWWHDRRPNPTVPSMRFVQTATDRLVGVLTRAEGRHVIPGSTNAATGEIVGEVVRRAGQPDTPTHVVSVNTVTKKARCGCRFPQHWGIPCEHTVAVLARMAPTCSPHDFVAVWWQTASLAALCESPPTPRRRRSSRRTTHAHLCAQRGLRGGPKRSGCGLEARGRTAVCGAAAWGTWQCATGAPSARSP